jgi:hypothetical protein
LKNGEQGPTRPAAPAKENREKPGRGLMASG